MVECRNVESSDLVEGHEESVSDVHLCAFSSAFSSYVVWTCCALLYLFQRFRLPQMCCSSGFRSSDLLHCVGWWLVIDILGQHIDPIFKGQTVQVLGPNVVPKRPLPSTSLRCITSENSEDFKTTLSSKIQCLLRMFLDRAH